MKTAIRLVAIISLVLVVLFAGIAGGIVLDRTALASLGAPSHTPAAGMEDQLQVLRQAWNIIDQRYVDQSAVEAEG